MYVFQKTAGRGWNVTLSCLWLLLVAYQAAYVSCDEYDNQILPGQLLFAPKRLLSCGSCLTATVATFYLQQQMNVSPIKVTLQKKRWLGDETLKMIVGRNVTTR